MIELGVNSYITAWLCRSLKLLNYDIFYNDPSNDWVIFIHGAGGSIATWKHQIEAFQLHYNMIAIDLRDHGLSKNIEPSFDTYDFNIIVSDVKKVLDALGVASAHFVTLSFGSVLMQAVYDRDPSLVKSMTLIGGIFNANWMIKAFVQSARFLNLFLPYHWMYRIFSYLLMPKKNHQIARRVYQMQARKLSQSEYLKWLGLYGEFFSLLKSFHQQEIDIPTIIIMGDEDYLFLPSAKEFAKTHSTVELVTISKAGHICNIERPEEVNQTILDFLDSQKDLAETLPTKETSVTN